MEQATVARGLSRGRRIALLVLAVLFGVAAGIGLFGWPSLVVGWFEGGDRIIHRVHDVGWGIMAGILLPVGFLAQARRPEQRIAGLQQAAMVGLAVGVAGLVAGEPGWLVGTLIVWVAVAILTALHPARQEFFPSGPEFSPALAGFTALAAIPLIWYGLEMASIQRDGIGDPSHLEEQHWTTMAAIAFGLVLLGILAALKPRGWRIPAWSGAVGAVVLGASFLVYPDYPGAEGSVWGAVLVVGGVLFAALAEWEAGRASLRT